MAVVKNKNTEENREFWSHVEKVSQQIDRAMPREKAQGKAGDQEMTCNQNQQDRQQQE